MGIEERTLCVLRKDLPEEWVREEIAAPLTEDSFKRVVDTLSVSYLRRSDIESDVRYKQIIPYVLVCDEEQKTLTYRRHGTEQRLHGLYSIGIGGHVNEIDRREAVFESILAGTGREVMEELGITRETRFTFLGVINEERTKVGHTHLGAVFQLTIDTGAIAPDAELAEWRFLPFPEVLRLEMELWSRLAISLFRKK